ncbi:MAG: hypothetical protein ACK50C_13885 [Gemmatimonadaceae bacterium]
MLTSQTLATLERALHGEMVLTVYLTGAARDPAERYRWQRELEPRLRDIAHALDDKAPEERAAFDACVDTLHAEIANHSGPLGNPSWVAMVTKNGVQHTATLPIVMDAVVTWQEGPDTVPYLRALRQQVPVLLVMADSRLGEIARVSNGHLDVLDQLEAEVEVELGMHMGDAPKPGFHAGTRGTAVTDAAQRSLRDASDHMLRDLAARVAKLTQPEDWVVLGGNAHLLPRLGTMLPAALATRTGIASSLDMAATPAERTRAATTTARQLRSAWEVERVNAVENEAASRSRGVVGPVDTHQALERAQVADLIVSDRFVQEHPEHARAMMRSAFAQGARVIEVEGEAQARLEPHGGVAAALRFTLEVPAT